MSLHRRCAVSLVRHSSALHVGRPITARSTTAHPVRQRTTSSQPSRTPSASVSGSSTAAWVAAAGCLTLAAGLSLIVLSADGLVGSSAASDDGTSPTDGLSHAPLPSAVNGGIDHNHSNQHQPQPASDTDYPAAATAAAAGANQPSSVPSPSGKPHLVILGSGWGAVSLLKGLDRDLYEVTVISPRNYFLFTPLLPSATTGQVESRTLMEPIRRICHRIRAHYFEGKVEHNSPINQPAIHSQPTRLSHSACADQADNASLSILTTVIVSLSLCCQAYDVDCGARVVYCRGYNGHEFTVPYDHLVLAVGAKNNTFGVDGADEYTYFLKSNSTHHNHNHSIAVQTAQVEGTRRPAHRIAHTLPLCADALLCRLLAG